jgi:PIN domain nuclease of toxin-antitoxin system
MIGIAVDTHVLLWYLLDRDRLPTDVLSRLDRSLEAGATIAASAISLVEIIYLTEKGRFRADTPGRIEAFLEGSDPGLEIVPVDHLITRAVQRIPRMQVPDMPDRIIAATALHLGIPLVTRDRRIRAADLETIW